MPSPRVATTIGKCLALRQASRQEQTQTTVLQALHDDITELLSTLPTIEREALSCLADECALGGHAAARDFWIQRPLSTTPRERGRRFFHVLETLRGQSMYAVQLTYYACLCAGLRGVYAYNPNPQELSNLRSALYRDLLKPRQSKLSRPAMSWQLMIGLMPSGARQIGIDDSSVAEVEAYRRAAHDEGRKREVAFVVGIAPGVLSDTQIEAGCLFLIRNGGPKNVAIVLHSALSATNPICCAFDDENLDLECARLLGAMASEADRSRAIELRLCLEELRPRVERFIKQLATTCDVRANVWVCTAGPDGRLPIEMTTDISPRKRFHRPPLRQLIGLMATLTLACVQTSSSGQQINEVKKVEQSPACRRAESFFTTHLDQRFPLHGGATTDIAADDWRQFFEAGGLLERALLYAKADRKTSQLRHLLRQLETRPISLRYSGSNGMTAEWNRVPWKPGRWRRMPSLGTEHRLAWTVGQEGDSQSLRYRGPWAWLHALRGATKMGNRASIRTYRLTMGDSRPPVHLSVRLPGLHQEPLTLLRQLRGRLATFFERCMLAYPHHNRGKKEEI